MLPVIVYRMLKDGTTDQELGAGCLDRPEPERLTRCFVKRLERLGHQVAIQSKEGAA